MTVKVAINGYTALGKRIADAVNLQDDMEVIGVSKTIPDFEAELLLIKEYPLFVAREDEMDFEDLGFVVEGDIRNMVEEADIVIDARPPEDSGTGLTIYSEFKKKCIFQSGSIGVCDHVFNSWANYDLAMKQNIMRIPSPDVTGLCRTLVPIEDRIGLNRISATVIRGAHPQQEDSANIPRALSPDIRHYVMAEPDLMELMPGIRLQVQTIDASFSRIGLHSVMVQLKQEISISDIADIFEKSFRIRLVSAEGGVRTLDQVELMAQDLGRTRSDLYENVIWGDGISVQDDSASFFQALDIANVVPENIDCIRAIMGLTDDHITSIQKTDLHLNVNI